jgi:hypothetical protein
VENDDVGYFVSDALGDAVEVLAAFSEDHESAVLANELSNVGEDEVQPVDVGR